jgi:hypothetical protein
MLSPSFEQCMMLISLSQILLLLLAFLEPLNPAVPSERAKLMTKHAVLFFRTDPCEFLFRSSPSGKASAEH